MPVLAVSCGKIINEMKRNRHDKSWDADYYYYNDDYDCGKGAKFLRNKRKMCVNTKCKFVFKRNFVKNKIMQYAISKCPKCGSLTIDLDPKIEVKKKHKR